MIGKHTPGMRRFTLVWAGQVISLVGTAMSQFALTIFAFELTGKATTLALVGFFAFFPTVILSPLAGALVDRSNRKLVMMVSDLTAALATFGVFLLASAGRLEIWHLYVAGFIGGTGQAFQFPAYSAAITLLIPKDQYARASGMMEFAQWGSGIVAPLLAGVLLGIIGLRGVLLIDLITFSAAFLTLALVYIPQPEATQEGGEGQGSLWQESLYGFRYIFKRPGLLGLQMEFFFANLFGTFGFTVLAAMILARTGSNELMLGTVQSIIGVGGVIGGLVLSVWGGPKRLVHGVLIGLTLNALLGPTLIGLGQGLFLWAVGGFFFAFFIPILNGSNQAIWQRKVAPDVQGRVFATRRLIAQITAPLAMLMAGPLADFVFEPAMMPGGSLAATFGGLIGTGPGAGMGLMFLITGLLGTAFALGGYLFPAIRNVEDILPDHEARVKEEEAEAIGVAAEAAEAAAT